MKPHRQYAALPYKVTSDKLKVCLITSRDTGRWIIPKGWAEDGVAPCELAATEAYEEAGLKGKTARKAIGTFRYTKNMDDGSHIECDVDVYPMRVKSQVADWPEKSERDVRWVGVDRAVKMLDDVGLKKLLKAFHPSK